MGPLDLLDAERPTEFVRLAAVRDVTLFSDAALVHLVGAGRRLVLRLDAEAGAFCRLLARAALPSHASPDGFRAQWRELGSEAFPYTAQPVARAAQQISNDASGWELPGVVAVTRAGIVLENAICRHCIAPGDVADVVVADEAVGLRDASSGARWVIRSETPDGARALASALWGRIG